MKRHMHRTRVAAAALMSLLTAALVLGFSTGSALAAVPRAFGHGLSVPAQSGSVGTLSGVLIVVGFFAAVAVITTIGWRLERRHLRQGSQVTLGATPSRAQTYADAMRSPHTRHGHAA
jgi:hypothetical protein